MTNSFLNYFSFRSKNVFKFPIFPYKYKGCIRTMTTAWVTSQDPNEATQVYMIASEQADTLGEISYNVLSTLTGGLTTSKTSWHICDPIVPTHGLPFWLWTFTSWVAIWKESSFMIRNRFGSEKKRNSIKYYLLAGKILILKCQCSWVIKCCDSHNCLSFEYTIVVLKVSASKC